MTDDSKKPLLPSDHHSPWPPDKPLGKWLLGEFKEHGWTEAQVAAWLGVAEGTLRSWRGGERRIKAHVALQLAALLRLPSEAHDDLLTALWEQHDAKNPPGNPKPVAARPALLAAIETLLAQYLERPAADLDPAAAWAAIRPEVAALLRDEFAGLSDSMTVDFLATLTPQLNTWFREYSVGHQEWTARNFALLWEYLQGELRWQQADRQAAAHPGPTYWQDYVAANVEVQRQTDERRKREAEQADMTQRRRYAGRAMWWFCGAGFLLATLVSMIARGRDSAANLLPACTVGGPLLVTMIISGIFLVRYWEQRRRLELMEAILQVLVFGTLLVSGLGWVFSTIPIERATAAPTTPVRTVTPIASPTAITPTIR